MTIHPILSAMLRSRTGPLLVAAQIALTLAVVSNALFVVAQRLEKMGRPSGIDSANLFFVESYGFGPDYDQRDTVRRDLDTIRALRGVVAASVTQSVPMSGGGARENYHPSADPGPATIVGNFYDMDEQALDALGARLVEGRGFRPEEIQYSATTTTAFVPAVIVTRDFARAMFGDETALGKLVYDDLGQSAVIVGVIDNMIGSFVNWSKLTQVMIHPRIPTGPTARYVVRTAPGQRDALMAEVERKLADSNVNRTITWVRPHSFFVERSYRSDRRMVVFLISIITLMIGITALGVVGLASFQVVARTKQIGTRRALGARRADILRHFMLENWMLTTGGAGAGFVLAFALSYWLSTAYQLPRLDPWYVLGGMIVLWVLGQLAVLVPARRASTISAAVATRTV